MTPRPRARKNVTPLRKEVSEVSQTETETEPAPLPKISITACFYTTDREIIKVPLGECTAPEIESITATISGMYNTVVQNRALVMQSVDGTPTIINMALITHVELKKG